MAYILTAAGQNSACDGHVDQLNGGFIKVKKADNTLLFTLTFGSPAFGDAGVSVDGRATANAITDGVAVASGIAAKATIHKSDDTEMGELEVGTSGSDINLDSVNIIEGQQYGLSTFHITMPVACGD
jgi:hypothetical protein